MDKQNMNIPFSSLKQFIRFEFPSALIYPTDREFFVESVSYVMDILKRTDARNIKPRGIQMQCEDISIYAWGMSKKLRYDEGIKSKDKKYDYSLPLGLCFGNLFNGIPGLHYQLLSYCKEGLYLIEPQRETYWMPTRADNVLWVTI